MRSEPVQHHSADAPIDLARVDPAARARLSGPGLRTFKAIAARWGLPEAHRRTLLGEPPRSTYHQWIGKAEKHEPLTLPLDTLLRISAVLGIHKALGILFVRESEALAWREAHMPVRSSAASPPWR